MLTVDFKPGTRFWGTLAEAVLTETSAARQAVGWPGGINHEGWPADIFCSFQRRVGSNQGDGRARF